MTHSADMNAHRPSPLHFNARWDRTLVPADGGTAYLLITISAAPISGTSENRAPIDVAFVLDRSGSMSGEKLELVKEATLTGLALLRTDDRAALVIYDHDVETIHYLSPCDTRAKARLSRVLKGVDSRGSTNLSDGWLTGCDQLSNGMANGGRARIRRALLLTDGLANMGIVDPGELMTHAGELRRRGISTTTVGVGEGFDEVLLSGMAEAGGGNFQYIGRPSELPAFFAEELGEMLTVVAAGLTLSVRLPHGVRAELVNAFPSDRDGKRIDLSLGDLPAGNELNLIIECSIKPGPIRTIHTLSVNASWSEPSTDRRNETGIPVQPLTLATRYDVERVKIDDEVAEEVAVQIATVREREAMRLDREGQRRESRAMLAQNAALLQAAPSSARVTALHSHFAILSEQNVDFDFAENTRKQSTSDAMRRSRGRKEHGDGSAS